MTNFQAIDAPKRSWITPERAVLVLPVFAGVVAAALALAFGFAPLFYQAQQRALAVKDLEWKKKQVPILRSQLSALLVRLDGAKVQQDRVLDLVAGTGELGTWLTAFNRIATRQLVTVVSIEPQPTERGKPKSATPHPVAPPAAAGSVAAHPSTPVDPLLAPNLEKRSALVILQGRFPRLKAVLQQLELLQVMAIPSDLELVPAPSAPQETQLKFKISTYGRIPQADAGSAGIGVSVSSAEN